MLMSSPQTLICRYLWCFAEPAATGVRSEPSATVSRDLLRRVGNGHADIGVALITWSEHSFLFHVKLFRAITFSQELSFLFSYTCLHRHVVVVAFDWKLDPLLLVALYRLELTGFRSPVQRLPENPWSWRFNQSHAKVMLVLSPAPMWLKNTSRRFTTHVEDEFFSFFPYVKIMHE